MTEQPMKLALSLDKVDEMSADAVKVEEIRKAYENDPSLLQEYEKAGYKSGSPFMQQIRDVLFLLGQVDEQSALVLRLENVCGDLREELDMQREEAERVRAERDALAARVAALEEEQDALVEQRVKAREAEIVKTLKGLWDKNLNKEKRDRWHEGVDYGYYSAIWHIEKGDLQPPRRERGGRRQQ